MEIVEVGDWVSFVAADVTLDSPVGQVVEIRTPTNPDRESSEIRVWCSTVGQVLRVAQIVKVVSFNWRPNERPISCDGL